LKPRASVSGHIIDSMQQLGLKFFLIFPSAIEAPHMG
jgi:hypothetical protein